MDETQIEQIIDRGLDYFDPLSLPEIHVYILPQSHPYWAYILAGGGMATMELNEAGYILAGCILLAEGFDEKWPDPVATDIVLHELSHLIDMTVNGDTDEDPARWQITSYIMEQEGWA